MSSPGPAFLWETGGWEIFFETCLPVWRGSDERKCLDYSPEKLLSMLAPLFSVRSFRWVSSARPSFLPLLP